MVFLGAERRSGHLERAFAEGGREIEIVPIYRTVAESPPSEELLGELNLGGEGLVFTFYSPSSFLSALELLGDRESLLREGRIYSLGPITTDAIRSQGYEVFAESKIQSDKGVIELLRDTSNLVYSSKSK